MAKKGFKIDVNPDNVVHTTISRAKDYNSARTVLKIGEKAYMSVSVEWEGEAIPEIVMGMMSMMQANDQKNGVEWSADKKKSFDFWKKKKKNSDDDEDEDKKGEDKKGKKAKK
jgi:hypothetical protein